MRTVGSGSWCDNRPSLPCGCARSQRPDTGQRPGAHPAPHRFCHQARRGYAERSARCELQSGASCVLRGKLSNKVQHIHVWGAPRTGLANSSLLVGAPWRGCMHVRHQPPRSRVVRSCCPLQALCLPGRSVRVQMHQAEGVRTGRQAGRPPAIMHAGPVKTGSASRVI
jgi:hypothetical protein